jgi:hypothetical protein
MLSEQDLVQRIFRTALEGCDGDVEARRNAIWLAATTMMADLLRGADPFTRERLLKQLGSELRDSVAHLTELLSPSPYPRVTH